MGEDTSKPVERYQIVNAMENTFKAGYTWEVLDTEPDNVMCATPTHELAELRVRLLNEHAHGCSGQRKSSASSRKSGQ